MSRRARQIGDAYEAARQRDGADREPEDGGGSDADEIGWKARLERVGVPLGASEIPRHPIEIDPGLIRFDLTWDRLGWGEDFDAFRKSIEDEGQLQPIVVVRDPARPGHYLGAFGRRRHEALRQLQKPVRAIVVEADDDRRVIFQGIENGARRDRSFIEMALFATQLLAEGRSTDTVMKALMVDETVVSRMRAVVIGLGEDLIKAIGPAPRHGRPRWEQLSRKLKDDTSARAQVMKVLQDEQVQALSSDDRFDRAVAALGDGGEASPAAGLLGADGSTVAEVKRVGGGFKVSTKDRALLTVLEEALREAASRYVRPA